MLSFQILLKTTKIWTFQSNSFGYTVNCWALAPISEIPFFSFACQALLRSFHYEPYGSWWFLHALVSEMISKGSFTQPFTHRDQVGIYPAIHTTKFKQVYEIDWKTMIAKHHVVRKAVSSPDLKTLMVLHFLFVCFLCLHKLNVETSVLAFNKKREDFETSQIQGGLATLSFLTPLIRVLKAVTGEFYINNDLLSSINMSVAYVQRDCLYV